MLIESLRRTRRWLARQMGVRQDAASRGLEGAGIAAPDSEAVDELFLSRLRRVTLTSQRKLTAGLVGDHPSPRRARAIEFADYRNYTPGDEFRQVDWNAYLRLDHLYVKLSEAPERLTLHLLLDGSRSMGWGRPDKFGYARRVATGLAYVALSHMDPVNLLLLRGRECLQVTRQESPSAISRVIGMLDSVKAEGDTDLDAALDRYAAQGNHRGMAILISDLLSPAGYQGGLEKLSRAALRPVVLHVLSPDEVSPSMEGDLELQDVETGEMVQVSADWQTLDRYRWRVKQWLREVEAFCARRGITYVRVESSYPVEQLLLGRLRREKVLR